MRTFLFCTSFKKNFSLCWQHLLSITALGMWEEGFGGVWKAFLTTAWVSPGHSETASSSSLFPWSLVFWAPPVTIKLKVWDATVTDPQWMSAHTQSTWWSAFCCSSPLMGSQRASPRGTSLHFPVPKSLLCFFFFLVTRSSGVQVSQGWMILAISMTASNQIDERTEWELSAGKPVYESKELFLILSSSSLHYKALGLAHPLLCEITIECID